MPSLASVIILLHQYGYLFLFLIAIIEGPIIAIVGAFLASQGIFNIYLVFVVTILGDLTGDTLYYAVGRFGRIPAVERFGEFIGVHPHHLERMEKYFETHGPKALFYAKFTQTGIIALPAAGMARMPYGQFLWYNLISNIPKSFILMLIGYFFGYAYQQIDSYFARISLVFFVAAVAIGAYFFIRQNRKLKV